MLKNDTMKGPMITIDDLEHLGPASEVSKDDNEGLVFIAVSNMTNSIWDYYVKKDPASISKFELRTFLNEFMKVDLTSGDFENVKEKIDHDNTGAIDKVKMARFILTISGHSKLAKNETLIKAAILISLGK